MPELPEVETIAEELRALIVGKTIRNITIAWPRTIEGDQKEFQSALINRKIIRIDRRGKYLCLCLEDELCLTIHLRMTGKLVFAPEEKDQKHIRVVFQFTDGTTLYFVDMRKFGRMKLWSQVELLLPHLGPDALDEKTVFQALVNQTSRRPIKTLLLDQEILAGVGNIYADEALFMAGIHPLTPLHKLTKQRLRKLSKHLPEILKAAIENNGTTISDYRRTDRLKGEHQFFLNVYGRE
ncbi:MAG: formamidopyrimidine-DNA glycosylase, partial [Acidobacteriota bacterium]|nr:formamidopyrimidine-DNA glycosylase [Acidobacteriota bacterium]